LAEIPILHLKRFGAILLMISFVTQAFTGAAILGNFYVNRNVYARNCVNKAKPQLHCNGRCQLMKQLKQREKQDNTEIRFTSKGTDLSSKSFFGSLEVYQAVPAKPAALYPPSMPVDRSYGFFHPPGIA